MRVGCLGAGFSTRRGRAHVLEEARRVRRLGEVLSSNVRRRAEGRVIFRA
jgi:hypothetical protein